MLTRFGYQLMVRTSSIEALEVFRATPDKFDLLITDMTMPNMTGVQLSKKILKIRPDMPIVICTDFSTGIDDEKAAASGIRGYIETFEKCSFLFKFKEGRNFNRRNTLSISRINI